VALEIDIMVRVGLTRCKTIMGRSGIGSVDYAVNPYIGCEHGCVYCYARFMCRMGHVGEEWGSFVDVKVNALERLRAEARRKRRGVVLFSSVTDPYQPVERRFRLTRGSLRILLDYDYPVVVQTKSALVLRDVDILCEFEECDVGFTIITANEEVRRVFEPRASPIADRLRALRVLREAGIDTYVFIGPLLPYLSEECLPELLDVVADLVDLVIFDRLNIKCGNLPPILKALRAHYPSLERRFLEALSSSHYYEKLRIRVSTLCGERGLPHDFCY
jgi:DNA repair photolyase